MKDQISISLTNDEALVLFQWLATIDASEIFAADSAEQLVLWKLEAQLEKVLTEPLDPNYVELIGHARERIARIKGGDGGN